MLFRDILLNYVDMDMQRNPIKNTAVENWAIENQHIKNFIIYFFTYILNFIYFVNLFFFDFENGRTWNLQMPVFKVYGK